MCTIALFGGLLVVAAAGGGLASDDAIVFVQTKHPGTLEPQSVEPSDEKYEIDATPSALALLSHFRVCGQEKLTHVGPFHDGGLVFPDIPQNTSFGTMFTIGVNNNDPVSHVLSARFGVKAQMYDCFNLGTSPCPDDLDGCDVTFHPECLGDRDGVRNIEFRYDDDNVVHKDLNFLSLESIVKQHDSSSNDMLLKIDCEGCEWESLDVLQESTLRRYKVILAEFHWLDDEDKHEQYLRVMKKVTKHFSVVHTHGCNCFGQVVVNDKGSVYTLPRIVEVTLVRKDTLTSPEDCSVPFRYLEGMDSPSCVDTPEHRDWAFNLPKTRSEMAFDNMDVDRNGKLDGTELSSFGFSGPGIRQTFDTDADGMLSRAEFYHAVTTVGGF